MEDINKESLSVWETNAQFWDNEMGDNSNFFHRDIVRPKTDELLNIIEGDYVLDIACGNGNYSQWLADKGATVVAFDYSSNMVALAQKRRADSLDNIDFHVCDATNVDDILKLKSDRPFNKAVANMAIMDISSVKPLFMAVSQMLVDGGSLVFSMHHPCFTFPDDNYLDSKAYKGVAIEDQPELQYYFHRPLEYIFNLAFGCGFSVTGFHEIPFEGESKPIIVIVRLSK